ncbi:MAG: hypothetical protein COA73_12135 [Candidatus Hydrogenedentota bacterium]|nr:MAG: hypothetical protein COA73_12135 [Candidatus Hydrogenedentota bacterium]
MSRGQHLHNKVLLKPVEETFQDFVWETIREFYVRDEHFTGFIDLLAIKDDTTIAVEIELSSRRVLRDVRKAEIANTDELWIVVPNSVVARQVKRALQNQKIKGINMKKNSIFICTKSTAISRVSNCFPPKNSAE